MTTPPINNQHPSASNSSAAPQKQTTGSSLSNQDLLQRFLQQNNMTGLHVRLNADHVSSSPQETNAPGHQPDPVMIHSLLSRQTPLTQLYNLPPERTNLLPQIVDLTTPISSVENSISAFKIKSIDDLVRLFYFLEDYIVSTFGCEVSAKLDFWLQFVPSRIELQIDQTKKSLSMQFKDLGPFIQEKLETLKNVLLRKFEIDAKPLFTNTDDSIQSDLQQAVEPFDKTDQKYLLKLYEQKYKRPKSKWSKPFNSNFACTVVYQILIVALKETMELGKLSQIIHNADLINALDSIFSLLQLKHPETDVGFKCFQEIQHFLPTGSKEKEDFYRFNKSFEFLKLRGLDLIKPECLSLLMRHYANCLSCFSHHLIESEPASAEAPEPEEASLSRKKQRTEAPTVFGGSEPSTSVTTIGDLRVDSVEVQQEIVKEVNWLDGFLD